jgi:hypothetical protein
MWILLAQVGQKTTEHTRLAFLPSRDTGSYTVVAEPLVWQGVLVHRWIHTVEVEGPNAAIATHHVSTAATGAAVVIILVLQGVSQYMREGSRIKEVSRGCECHVLHAFAARVCSSQRPLGMEGGADPSLDGSMAVISHMYIKQLAVLGNGAKGNAKGTYHIVRVSVSAWAISFTALTRQASKRPATFFLHRAIATKNVVSMCASRKKAGIQLRWNFAEFGLGRTVRQTIEAKGQ